ncbi:hypothetical protein ACWIUH_05950 [Ursidibacter arcticus]
MKKILQKCTDTDFKYISDILDSYVAFTNDSKRKKLLKQTIENQDVTAREELIELMDKQIRYYGSSDVAYIFRGLFNDDGGVTAEEVVKDVAEKLKVKVKLGASTERTLELLVQAVVEKEFLSKSDKELADYFKKLKLNDADSQRIFNYLKENGKVVMLPVLLKVLGTDTTLVIIQSIIITIIAQFIGKKAADQLIKELVKRNPWLNALGPVVWVLSTTWLAFDLQGEAYRKTVPICLYLGIVGLRDGQEKN